MHVYLRKRGIIHCFKFSTLFLCVNFLFLTNCAPIKIFWTLSRLARFSFLNYYFLSNFFRSLNCRSLFSTRSLNFGFLYFFSFLSFFFRNRLFLSNFFRYLWFCNTFSWFFGRCSFSFCLCRSLFCFGLFCFFVFCHVVRFCISAFPFRLKDCF